ncbi:MAG: hypothetical protein Q8P67_04600, partial [archaeon]|nr:hypothetical protein [archaeon]
MSQYPYPTLYGSSASFQQSPYGTAMPPPGFASPPSAYMTTTTSYHAPLPFNPVVPPPVATAPRSSYRPASPTYATPTPTPNKTGVRRVRSDTLPSPSSFPSSAGSPAVAETRSPAQTHAYPHPHTGTPSPPTHVPTPTPSKNRPSSQRQAGTAPVTPRSPSGRYPGRSPQPTLGGSGPSGGGNAALTSSFEAPPGTYNHDNALLKPIVTAARKLVSRDKHRLTVHGFDLDLTYILDGRLIAMGIPGTRADKAWRNNADEVADFFRKFHAGQFQFYNLSGLDYDYAL